jgi:hypothetical protein
VGLCRGSTREPAVSLGWNRAGGEVESLKSIADSVEARTKLTAQWKYIMPNGEIRTHFGCAPSYLADGTVLFNAVILDGSR